MDSIFHYLNIFLLSIPFLLAFDKHVFPLKKIVSLLLPSLFVTIVFSETGVFFAGAKIFLFNLEHTSGIVYRYLPLEMYLFYFATSFSSLGIYSYLNAKYPNNDLQKYSLLASNILLGVFVAIMFFSYTYWYTIVTFVILFFLLIYIEYRNSIRFMYRFYRAYLVCLIPFYISYGILCNVPIIKYKFTETINSTLFNIPFENHFYMMGMLLLGVFLLEVLEARKAK